MYRFYSRFSERKLSKHLGPPFKSTFPVHFSGILQFFPLVVELPFSPHRPRTPPPSHPHPLSGSRGLSSHFLCSACRVVSHLSCVGTFQRANAVVSVAACVRMFSSCVQCCSGRGFLDGVVTRFVFPVTEQTLPELSLRITHPHSPIRSSVSAYTWIQV